MKNCVVFNDLSGYGNCSLMADIPVLTVMGVRVHPVPTAVLTRQTGYDRYSMEDLTGFMPQFAPGSVKISIRRFSTDTGF